MQVKFVGEIIGGLYHGGVRRFVYARKSMPNLDQIDVTAHAQNLLTTEMIRLMADVQKIVRTSIATLGLKEAQARLRVWLDSEEDELDEEDDDDDDEEDDEEADGEADEDDDDEDDEEDAPYGS